MYRRLFRFEIKVALSISLILVCAAGARSIAHEPRIEYVDLRSSRLSLVRVPAGIFKMGTNQVITTSQGWDNEVERPTHEVRITKDFWMGRFPVTQGQWQEVMGNNPSYCRDAGPDAPVGQVSWNDSQATRRKRRMAGSTKLHGTEATILTRPIRSAKNCRIRLDYTICWEMCGSGARIGLGLIQVRR